MAGMTTAAMPKFAAATAKFDPAPFSLTSDVLDATFVTRCPPDVERHTTIVGVCAVPSGREGTDDMGWHVADFLAFKSLFDSQINPRYQAWISYTDANLAATKHGYTHSGRRLDPSNQSHDVPIVIEPSASKLAAKIISQIFAKAQLAKDNGESLIIIVCGPTTLEQDICLGDDYKASVTSEQISAVIDTDIDVTFVTPSITSAGWQVNPSFKSKHGTLSVALRSPSASPIDFMARQCGAIFASKIIPYLSDSESPLIDHLADPSEFPLVMTEDQKQARASLEIGIYSLLARRMINGNGNHTFSFETETDQWEDLLGRRKGRSLEKLSQQWEKLPAVSPANTTKTTEYSTGTADGEASKELRFLGGAFGGNKASQISHIKHLIKESLNSWPGYYSTSFGQLLRRELDEYLDQTTHDDLEWHTMFNISKYIPQSWRNTLPLPLVLSSPKVVFALETNCLESDRYARIFDKSLTSIFTVENRISLMVLGDLVTKNFRIPPVFNARCRDWDEAKWSSLVTTLERNLTTRLFGEVHRHLPPICLPPGRNINLLRKTHMRVTRATQYIAAALTMRFRQESPLLDTAVKDVVRLFQKVEARQVELIMESRDVRALSTAWLDSIGIPVNKNPGKLAKTDLMKHGVVGTPDQYVPKQTSSRSAAIAIKRPPSNTESLSVPKSSLSGASPVKPASSATVPRPSTVEAEVNNRETQRSGNRTAIYDAMRRDIEAGAAILSLQAKTSIQQMPTKPLNRGIKKPRVANGPSTQSGMQKEPESDIEEHLPPHLRKRFIPKPPSKSIQEGSTATQKKPVSAQHNSEEQSGYYQPEKSVPDPEAHLLPHLRKVFRPRTNKQAHSG
jgi:hypothetical protein